MKKIFVALAVLTGSVGFAQKKVKQPPPPPPLVEDVKFPPPTLKTPPPPIVKPVNGPTVWTQIRLIYLVKSADEVFS